MTDAEKKDDFRKLMRAYTGFQMATALLIATKTANVCGACVVLSLLAVSIPATFAYSWFARLTPEDEQLNPPRVTFICGICAFFPSLAAISILFASVSLFAAIAFPIATAAWFATTIITRKSKQIQPPSHDIK